MHCIMSESLGSAGHVLVNVLLKTWARVFAPASGKTKEGLHVKTLQERSSFLETGQG